VARGEPFNTPYHPQAWPIALKDEIAAVHNGLEAEITWLTLAKIMRKMLIKKLFDKL
jgi:hypothetical protein